MTPERIAELRALAAAATPGPWTCMDESRGTAVGTIDGSITITRKVRWVTICNAVAASNVARANASYIAAACNAVPRLCDEIERLTRELREARRVVAEIYHLVDSDREAKAMKRAGDLTRHIDSVLGAPAIRAAEGGE